MNPYLLVNLKQKYCFGAPSGAPTGAPIEELNGYTYIYNLMKKLSHRSKVICALEAVQMVLKKKKEKEKLLLREAIEVVEKWIAGKEIKEEELDITESALCTISNRAFMDDDCVCFQITNTVSSIIHAIMLGDDVTFYEPNATAHATDAIINSVNMDAVVRGDFKLGMPLSIDHNIYYKWWNTCYPLIEKELQGQYDSLCKQILEDI